MVSFFSTCNPPLSKIYANLHYILGSSDLTEIKAYLKYSLEIINKELKRYK